jgi:hypothetical protein
MVQKADDVACITAPQPISHHKLILQRDFIQLREVGKPSLSMRDVCRMVAPLPVLHQVQYLLSVKLPLGQDPEQQHLHLGQGQARHFFLI